MPVVHTLFFGTLNILIGLVTLWSSAFSCTNWVFIVYMQGPFPTSEMAMRAMITNTAAAIAGFILLYMLDALKKRIEADYRRSLRMTGRGDE
ncbi:hypothetical protein [Deinococcus pimensis]|uniref:hypothetical protein n=1 Tax=Deinococcus pimensis TaxID=309888 RepID=UPI0012FC6940|nr:hypothetical protein [Deinococcus pimensis]